MGEEDKVEGMLREILEGQQKQSDKLEAHGETLSEYGDAIEELSGTVTELQGDTKDNFTRMGTEFGHLKDRAAEDRQAAERRAKDATERADKKETEMEKKVGDAHVHANQSGTKADTLAGQFKNHIEDDHATLAATTAEGLDNHIKNKDRHVGTAPEESDGGGLHPGVKYGGGATVLGGIAYGIIEFVKAISGS
jgi:myosin heavy subunit